MRVVINGQPHELAAGSSLAAVVQALPGVPDGRGVAVALDGEVVSRHEWESTKVSDGARIELVVAVQGG